MLPGIAGSTETVTPTTYDLDAVSQQFAAMAQAPGAREMLQNQLAGAISQLDGTVADNLAASRAAGFPRIRSPGHRSRRADGVSAAHWRADAGLTC